MNHYEKLSFILMIYMVYKDEYNLPTMT